jgi:hypothetical protein
MKLAFPEAGAALLLPLTLLAVFPAPAGNSPVGLSLAWLACMLLLALPVSFLEFALVRRTRQWPLQGIAQITRDTDVRTTWRAVVPLGLALLAVLAGLSAGATADFVPVEPDWLTDAAPWLLLLPALGMAWAGTGRFLGVGGLLAVAAVMTALALGGGSWTPGLPDADGWRYAVLMALLTGGGGYSAWLALRRTADDGAAAAVLPFWGLQLLSGVLMLLTGDLRHQPAACVYAVPALFTVALMLEILMQQGVARGRSKPVALGMSAAAVAGITVLAAVPTFLTVVQMVAVLPVLALAVFVGWVMKISHVRKALNLPSEGVYNLWRVAVRLLVPLACLWVIAGRFL